MSSGTASNVCIGYAVADAGLTPAGDTAVAITGRAVTQWPDSLAEYMALPEHDSPTCPECKWAGVIMVRELCECCRCGFRWRWPFTVGMD